MEYMVPYDSSFGTVVFTRRPQIGYANTQNGEGIGPTWWYVW